MAKLIRLQKKKPEVSLSIVPLSNIKLKQDIMGNLFDDVDMSIVQDILIT
jgi:hypothetical protein